MEKSSIRISRIRTGHGDKGDTKLGGKLYRKGHPLVKFSAELDLVQSFTYNLPQAWGDFKPREILQELLFRLGAVVGGSKPKDQEIPIQELASMLEDQIESISGGLEMLDSFIRCSDSNYGLQQLRAAIRAAESQCVAATDYLELEAKDTSENMLYMLNLAARALNIASDWVFAFVWAYSVDDNGKLLKENKWIPWPEEKFRVLNV